MFTELSQLSPVKRDILYPRKLSQHACDISAKNASQPVAANGYAVTSRSLARNRSSEESEIHILLVVGLSTVTASLAYLTAAIAQAAAFRPSVRGASSSGPAISILKPVCGLEPNLFENLSSFCEQDYSEYQIVFGALAGDDPAIAVVKRVIERYPARDLSLVIGGRAMGANRKVSNLANMLSQARYQILVTADSDTRVDRFYLRALAAPFDDPEVAAVTCLYKGIATRGLACRLGAMYINDSFAPSALVAMRTQKLAFCFGATTAVKRAALEEIGGFAALADQLADDYQLGKMLTERGHKIALARYVVEVTVHEPSLKTLLRHELRWARTLRAVRPAGYAASLLTHTLILSSFLLVARVAALSAAVLAVSAMLRVLLHYLMSARFGLPARATPWLIPLRDALSFGVWVASFCGRTVHWRGRDFVIDAGGRLIAKDKT